MSIQIISVGFPSTGTITLKAVLKTLRFNNTYRFKVLIANSENLKYWKELETIKTMVKTQMENAYKLEAPIDVDLDIGDNCLEVH